LIQEGAETHLIAVTERETQAITVREQTVVVVEVPAPASPVATAQNVVHLVEVIEQDRVVVDQPQTVVVAAGQQGPSGPPGSSGASAIFIQDVVGIDGIVALKMWEDTVPPEAHIVSATSDTETVRVWVGAGGGATYSPFVTVNDIPVVLTESSTKRWFTGHADLTLEDGENLIVARTTEGLIDTAVITLAGPGPDILSVTFGAYPGAQTELKAGDSISVTVTTEPEAIELTILVAGAATSAVTLPVVGGVATGSITISGASGQQPVVIRAKNDLGTYGADHTSVNTVLLNQTYPTISVIGASYPGLQGAFNLGEAGTISATVSNFDTISYVSPDLAIDAPTAYAPSKTIANFRTGYVGTGTNITITANRAANNATTTRTGLARIATVPPKAAISIAGNPSRLISSPTGQDYEVRITPDQMLSGTPSLDASLGTWLGAWVLSGSYWKRTLRITDSTARGTGVFANLTITGLSGIPGNEITAGSTYVVGGMVTRNITFPAFARVAAIGATVGDATRTSAQVSGGNALARQTNNAVVANGYYIANGDGSYNAQGAYLGLSDTAFAGSNTSGSLVVIFGETA
jgi:hypothetical protein